MPGELGLWLFIFGDMGAFAVMFAVLVLLYRAQPEMYEGAQSHLHIAIGLVNTILLLTSSLFVARAVQATRAADTRKARLLIQGALACGTAFIAMKAVEWTDLLRSHHGPRANEFFLYFFGFTGLHLLHVCIGVAVLLGLRQITKRQKIDAHDQMMVENGAGYWHMVDLLWVVLFVLFYLWGARG